MYYRGLQDGVISREFNPKSKGEAPMLANIHLIDYNPWPPSVNGDKRGEFPCRDQWRLTLHNFILHFITSPILNAGTPSPPRTLSSLITSPKKKKKQFWFVWREASLSSLSYNTFFSSLLFSSPSLWIHEINCCRHGNMLRDRTMATNLVKEPLLKRVF